MSRLYYPPVVNSRLASGEADTKQVAKDTAEKVAKLIPAELITGYSGLISVCSDFHSSVGRYVAYGISFLVCATLTPIYLNLMAENGKPKTIHLIESTVAFIVWAYFTSGRQVLPDYLFNGTGALVGLLIFTLVSGVIKPTK